MTIFLSLLRESDKAVALEHAIGHSTARLVLSADDLRQIPTSPFAYWTTGSLRSLFRAGPVFEADDRVSRQGLATTNDQRFVRVWWEISPVDIGDRWVHLLKGGDRSRYYNDVSTLVLWRARGYEIKQTVALKYPYLDGNYGFVVKNESVYRRPGMSWPLRRNFDVHATPSGCIPSVAGKIATGPEDHLPQWLSILNSSTFRYLMLLFAGESGGVQFEAGLVGRVPVPLPDHVQSSDELGELAHRGWFLKRSLDTCSEMSHAFVVPALLQVEGARLADRLAAWSARVAAVEAELAGVQLGINNLCFELYGISDEDRRAITEGFGVADPVEDAEAGDADAHAEPEGADPTALAAGLVAWAVGVASGRFDVRLATRDREWPVEPDPFDALPVCSPAMLIGDDCLPLDELPVGYPMVVSPVLVNDPGHGVDITARVRAVFDAVFGADADSWWSDVGEALGARRGEISTWLRKGFFDHHLKSYSKSRRKAPILWPIGTASGSYVVWLYAHRVTADSLFQVLNDIVEPKVGVEQRRLTELTQDAGPNPSASERKAIDAQETLVGELRELRDDLVAVTPLWAPDLNDGIVVVLAPLWRLFAHHKPWSKELRKHWDKLAAGDYDWAQLAMHLWPERVIPKCAEDRSLAIAHGLEDVFWVQDPDNTDKWHPRTTPTTPIEQLIAQRHNPATKAALEKTT